MYLLAIAQGFGGAQARPLALCHPVEMPSDEELIGLLRAGDGDAAAQLVERYGRPIFSYLRRMVPSHETAEDLFQETWVRLVEKCGTYKPGQPVRPWLYRIALNILRDHVRRESAGRRGGGAPHLPLEPELAGSAPPQDVARRDEEQALHRAVESLPMKFREVIALRYFEELSVEEVASVIRRPAGTVKSRLARGLKMLQGEMEKLQ